VKRERLEFLADNPFYTKRFAYYVGRRCRTATVQDIAKELKLDWHTVKELDKQYMKAQLAKAGKPRPKVIGVDEIAIRKGHTYRIVVSDLEKTRPIWFGGQDRSEESLTQFFAELGKSKSARIRLAVMDMWKNRFERLPKRVLLKRPFSTTSFMCCVIWERRSIECEKANTVGFLAKTDALSRDRNTRCCRTGTISLWKAAKL